MKKFIFPLVCISLIILFTRCEEKDSENIHENDTIVIRDTLIIQDTIYVNSPIFGATISNLKPDSIYKANTDGFLYVKIISDGLDWSVSATVLSDTTTNPTETLGIISYFGSITLPIQKNNYWKVKTNGYIKEINISWTPIN